MKNKPTRIKLISSTTTTNNKEQKDKDGDEEEGYRSPPPIQSLKRKQPPPLSPSRTMIMTTTTTNTPSSSKLSLRIKLPTQPNPIPPSPSNQPQIDLIRSRGSNLWHRIVNSTDSDGRTRSPVFMDLPSAIDYPDYYHLIQQPMALNPIKLKLNSQSDPYLSYDHPLPNPKLIFTNAKRYNLERSRIYRDAQALLKIAKREPPLPSPQPIHPPIPSPYQPTQLQPDSIIQPKPKRHRLTLNGHQPTTPDQLLTPSIDPPQPIKHSNPTTILIPPTPLEPEPHPPNLSASKPG